MQTDSAAENFSRIDLNKPAPEPAAVKGSMSDPNYTPPSELADNIDYARRDTQKLPDIAPPPATSQSEKSG